METRDTEQKAQRGFLCSRVQTLSTQQCSWGFPQGSRFPVKTLPEACRSSCPCTPNPGQRNLALEMERVLLFSTPLTKVKPRSVHSPSLEVFASRYFLAVSLGRNYFSLMILLFFTFLGSGVWAVIYPSTLK